MGNNCMVIRTGGGNIHAMAFTSEYINPRTAISRRPDFDPWVVIILSGYIHTG
jgi:hypothetical protein